VTKFGRIQTKFVSPVPGGARRIGSKPNHQKLFYNEFMLLHNNSRESIEWHGNCFISAQVKSMANQISTYQLQTKEGEEIKKRFAREVMSRSLEINSINHKQIEKRRSKND